MSEGAEVRPDPTTAFGGFADAEIEEASGIAGPAAEGAESAGPGEDPGAVRPPVFDGELDRTPLVIRFADGGR